MKVTLPYSYKPVEMIPKGLADSVKIPNKHLQSLFKKVQSVGINMFMIINAPTFSRRYDGSRSQGPACCGGHRPRSARMAGSANAKDVKIKSAEMRGGIIMVGTRIVEQDEVSVGYLVGIRYVRNQMIGSFNVWSSVSCRSWPSNSSMLHTGLVKHNPKNFKDAHAMLEEMVPLWDDEAHHLAGVFNGSETLPSPCMEVYNSKSKIPGILYSPEALDLSDLVKMFSIGHTMLPENVNTSMQKITEIPNRIRMTTHKPKIPFGFL